MKASCKYYLPFVVVGLIIGMLTGCKSTILPVEHTITQTDTVILREKLVPFSVNETIIEKTFTKDQIDSMIIALKAMPRSTGQTIYYTDPKLRTQLSFFLDSIGNLVTQCKSLEHQFSVKIQEKDHIIVSQEKQIVELKKSTWEQIKTFLNNGLWSIVIVLILIIAIGLIMRKNGN